VKTKGWLFVIMVVVLSVIAAAWIAMVVSRYSGHVSVLSKPIRFGAGAPPLYFSVTVTNDSDYPVKDVWIRWNEYAPSGTCVGMEDQTFFEVVGARKQASFMFEVKTVYPQAVRAEAQAMGWRSVF